MIVYGVKCRTVIFEAPHRLRTTHVPSKEYCILSSEPAPPAAVVLREAILITLLVSIPVQEVLNLVLG